MRVCGFDIETTGLDFEKDRVTEFAWIIKDIGDPKFMCAQTFFIYDEAFQPPFSDENSALTKITSKHVKGRSTPLADALYRFEADLRGLDVEALVGHYAFNFDRPFLASKIKKQLPELSDGLSNFSLLQTLPLIDTRDDIEYPANFKSRSLTHVAAELGFLNPFPHSALFDVATCLKVLECFDVEKVFARSKEPWVIIRAMVSYDDRELAKVRRYQWEKLGDCQFPKMWVKRVKASEVQKEVSEATFLVQVLEG
jgi:DNA polymerase-3 subunit epsilon